MATEGCNDDFQNVLTQFMTDAGYNFCEVADVYVSISQLNSDQKYNLQKIIDGIKLAFTPPNWKEAFDLILEKGLVVKCYLGEGNQTAIYMGGVNDFINRFGE